MIMVDARNVSMLSLDITVHNGITSRGGVTAGAYQAGHHPRRPPTPLPPAAITLTSNEADNFSTTSALYSSLALGKRGMVVTSPGPHSGLIVEVPEAEPAVARLRERLDASAPLGIPAHIMVLFPFMPLGTIDPAALSKLARLFAAVSRFGFRLDRTDWFGDEVLWLGPDDPGPFRALTEAVHRAYPRVSPLA